jgi:hypothetical protein
MSYIGKEPIVGNFQKCDAITTSSTATYNLTVSSAAVFPETANNCIVSLNGVIQAPTSAYTISGSQIVFASSLASSDVIDFILILGSVLNVGTPTDRTVTLAKMATGTDGQIITYDASGNPTAVGPGSDGQVLTSTGAGSPPAFEAVPGGGLCLQVLGMTKTDTTSLASTSFADISGMTIAITPTKTSSRILLAVNLSIGAYTLGSAGKIQRDIAGGGYSDLLIGDAASSRTRCTWHFRAATGGVYTVDPFNCTFLDTPSYSSGNEITYKIQWSATGGNTIYLNRAWDDSDTANYPRSASSMTVMEID